MKTIYSGIIGCNKNTIPGNKVTIKINETKQL